MEGKIINIDGFKAIGLTYFGNNSNVEIPKLWEVAAAKKYSNKM